MQVKGTEYAGLFVYEYPTITTISQPEYQLGLSSCELLVERLTNPETPISNILLAIELIVRESSTLPHA
ncbi:hypothetical protein AGMMS49940_14170 [Spirochaetia bacterium]|nr:hypothetical protein AGMMS49940_14170 [Spirochaetia bacterium]